MSNLSQVGEEDEKKKKGKKEKKSKERESKNQSSSTSASSVDDKNGVVDSLNFLSEINYDGTFKDRPKSRPQKLNKKTKKKEKKDKKTTNPEDHLLFEITQPYRSKTPIHFIQETTDGQGISYKQYLQSEWLMKENRADSNHLELQENYNLENSKEKIISQLRRKLLRDDFKKIFKRKLKTQENINIRSKNILDLQMRMLLFALEKEMELTALALSFHLFDRLIHIKKTVNNEKKNIYCATCILLALKFEENLNEDIKNHVSSITEAFDITPKELLQNEFAVFSELEFSLFCPIQVTFSYLKKIHHILSLYANNERYL